MQRPRPREMRVRAFASRLGHGQTKDALNAAIARLGDKKEHAEVLACWMHELVLRGTSLDRESAVVKFHARLAEEKHPLGGMPLTMLEAESEAPTYMPMYGANAISKAVARLESGPQSTRTIPPPGEHVAPRTTRIDDAALEARLREAIVPWTDGFERQGGSEGLPSRPRARYARRVDGFFARCRSTASSPRRRCMPSARERTRCGARCSPLPRTAARIRRASAVRTDALPRGPR